jgi:hypothetical protein
MSVTEIIPTFEKSRCLAVNAERGAPRWKSRKFARPRRGRGGARRILDLSAADGNAARREGAVSERVFDSREVAESDVALLATRCRSYRLFVEQENGKFAEENAGWPAAVRRLIADND